LLGLFAGRKQYFQYLDRYQSFTKRLFLYVGLLIVAVGSLYVCMIVASRLYRFPTLLMSQVVPLLHDTAKAGLTVGYIAGFTLLLYRYRSTRFVAWLSRVGQMALTHYVLQSLMGTLIFYGYGLGLMSQVSVTIAASLAIPMFGFQLLVSHWWLKHFRYGPFEWVWRSLTYLRWQPMGRHAAASAVEPVKVRVTH